MRPRRASHADAAAVEEDAGFAAAVGDGLGGGDRKIGVVGGVGGSIAAKILGVVPQLLEQGQELALGLKTAMIGRDGYLHVLQFPSVVHFRSRQRSFFESMFDERLQLSGQRLIQAQVAADGIVDIPIRIERHDFFDGRWNQGDDGLGMPPCATQPDRKFRIRQTSPPRSSIAGA